MTYVDMSSNSTHGNGQLVERKASPVTWLTNLYCLRYTIKQALRTSTEGFLETG